MTDPHQIDPANPDDAAALRGAERRRFLTLVGRSGAAAGGLALLSACGGGSSSSTPTPTPTPTPTATSSTEAADISILNFALQIEYLAAQYYAWSAFGAGLPAADLTGTGTQGAVTGGAVVNFSDAVVAACAREIARDKRAHVEYLRSLLGSYAVSQPAINIAGGAGGAFAGIGAGAQFNPYASDETFLYGAFMFEDVMVTAYKGLSPSITAANYLATATGILGATAHHAGLIRTLLYARGFTAVPAQISDWRDSMDGTQDLDQGIAGASAAISNIAPDDGNGIIYSRSTGQVLNVLYQNKAAVTSGGFFPAGLNGVLNSSIANS